MSRTSTTDDPASIESVAIAPISAAVWRDEDIQAGGVRELLRPAGRPDAAQLGVGQHVLVHPEINFGTNECTNNFARYQDIQ
jgi:hypothetical protein